MDASVVVFLEGLDDWTFFDSVLHGELAKRYNVRPRLYASKDKETLKQIVETMHKTNRDYIVFADFDKSTCYSGRKATLRKIPNARHGNIAVVKTEIESWYLAGMGQDECARLQIPYHSNTESVSKEYFEQMLERGRWASRKDFMEKILEMFDVGRAKKQNASFRYVWDKFVSGTAGARAP